MCNHERNMNNDLTLSLRFEIFPIHASHQSFISFLANKKKGEQFFFKKKKERKNKIASKEYLYIDYS